MRFESRLFLYMVPFFLVVTAVYAFWSDFEPVGSAALLLVAATVAMIGYYLHMLAGRISARPEDNPYAEVADGAGEQGVFSPWSWWPLILAFGAALVFASLAVGWWLFGIGAVVGVFGLVGWVFEFSRGQHAH